MTRNYKDYKIRTTLIQHPDYGAGYAAEVFIPKINGTKANVMILHGFDTKMKPSEIVDFCKKIIDLR